MSTLALFLALGGSAFAVARIGSGDIRDNSIRSADVRDRGLTGRDIRPGSIGSREVAGLRLKDFASGALAQREALERGQTVTGVFAATVTGGPDDFGVGRGAISFPLPMKVGACADLRPHGRQRRPGLPRDSRRPGGGARLALPL